MKRRHLKFTIPVALVSLAAAFLTSFSSFDYQNASVKEVVDGDTVVLSNGKSARYIGIDTPETHKKTQAGWIDTQEPFGKEAARFNKELVLGKALRLEFDVQRQDKYKRLLIYCFVTSGDKEVLAQAELLRQGLAYLYTFPPNVKYVDTLVAALKEAKENRRGIWSQDLMIASQDAGQYTGQRKIVVGTVQKTRSSKKLVRLTMDGLMLIIFSNNLEAMFLKKGIDPSEFYKGKKVRVFGLIKEYNGKPEIIVSNPWQIEVVS
jgi:endonuclease YncB( thermonuclease family)